jgi:hypothetical protein
MNKNKIDNAVQKGSVRNTLCERSVEHYVRSITFYLQKYHPILLSCAAYNDARSASLTMSRLTIR